MALVNCKYHNRQPVTFTCQYIHDCIVNHSKIDKNIYFIKIDLDLFGGWVEFWADSNFLSKNKIKEPKQNKAEIVIQHDSNDEEKNFCIYSNTIPICQKCYEAFGLPPKN